MSNKQSGQPIGQVVDMKDLRLRAEKNVLAKEHFDLGEPPPGEVRGMYHMLHELRVHQAELEMQNDELRKTREELEASRQKYFGFYNLAPVGYFTIGEKDLVVEANLTSANLLGMDKNRLVGELFTRLIAAEDRDAWYLLRRKLHETGRPQSCELRMIRPDGTRFWARMDVAAAEEAEDGACVNYAVMSDISGHVASEEKLKAAKEEAEAATVLKDKFVSLVAHDLRSPLASMLLLQKFTIAKHKDRACDECRVSLGMLTSAAEGMMEMTDELLESARLQRGSILLDRKICNVREICDAVMASLGYLAAVKEVVLKNEVPHDIRVYADKTLFQSVIHNVVMNALKFSAKGGVVTTFLPGGQNVFAVKDTGTGIGKKLLPDLFKHEVKTTTVGTSGERGTGFGLPMCMDIIKAHGGTMRATSRKGEGYVFFVELPDIKPLALVAGDDEMSAFVLRGYLEEMGAEVARANSGFEAWEIIQNKEPALIIIDLKMPAADSFVLLQNIKNSPKHSRIPAIIVTSKTDLSVREKAFEYRADDFITKPLSESDFMPRIGRFITA